jgi:hypothetical protein
MAIFELLDFTVAEEAPKGREYGVPPGEDRGEVR